MPLIDQPGSVTPPRAVQQEGQEDKKHPFHGVLKLSAHEAKALGQCVMILDAVIRQVDHSGATLHAWRGKSPLKQLLSKNRGSRPGLRKLIFETQGRGITLDFEMVLSELVEIWSSAHTTQLDPEQIRALVSAYYPVGSVIKMHDLMTAVFEKARRFLNQSQTADPSLRSG